MSTRICIINSTDRVVMANGTIIHPNTYQLFLERSFPITISHSGLEATISKGDEESFVTVDDDKSIISGCSPNYVAEYLNLSSDMLQDDIMYFCVTLEGEGDKPDNDDDDD